MAHVYVTRRIPDAGLLLLRDAGHDISLGQGDDDAPIPYAEVLAGVVGADLLLPLITERVDRAVMEAEPLLRGIANYGVGFDNIDVPVATELGLPVSNTPGVLTETTADTTWALLLAVARRITEADAFRRSGRWKIWGPNQMLGSDVGPDWAGNTKTLGIVGFGRIGKAVARRAAGFDLTVLAHDPDRRQVDDHPGATWVPLEELLERSDFVTLHPLLNEQTHHLIGEPELRRMKRTAYLVNVSRGPVVHEAALVRALREGWIAGAGLDVYEQEPELTPGLRELPNAVLLPHIGSASRETRDRMATLAATNGLHHLRGERAPEVVNPEVYETEAYGRRRDAWMARG